MTINEMHIAFRTIAQQMGLHLYRAILPESIDTYLNFSIREVTQSIINNNVSEPYKDKFTHQDNDISPVNSLMTLVRSFTIKNNNVNIVGDDVEDKFVCVIPKLTLDNPMFYTSFGITIGTARRFVHCRFVENDKLHSTIADYCNAASNDYPIITLNSEDKDNVTFNIYKGDNKNNISHLMITYLKHPNIVKYDETGATSVDCDLPKHLHNKVVELAVTKYVQSVNLTSQTIKEQK